MCSKAVIERPPDVVARIDARVASGASSDPVDAIREGLTALDSEDAKRLEAIRRNIVSARGPFAFRVSGQRLRPGH